MISGGCPPISSGVSDNGLILSSAATRVGTTVEFVCAETDDVMVGKSTLTCLPTGSWDGAVPRCMPVSGKDIALF